MEQSRCRLDLAPLELVIEARGSDTERCGLLFGTRHEAGHQVAAACELDNRAGRPDRFYMDPAEIVSHARRRRAEGLELLGSWHTHPTSSAELSQHDRAGASEGWLSLIVGCTGELRAYEHGADGAARELMVLRADQAPRPQ
jgi:proteasome lid subunit RPN8/RPN11